MSALTTIAVFALKEYENGFVGAKLTEGWGDGTNFCTHLLLGSDPDNMERLCGHYYQKKKEALADFKERMNLICGRILNDLPRG